MLIIIIGPADGLSKLDGCFSEAFPDVRDREYVLTGLSSLKGNYYTNPYYSSGYILPHPPLDEASSVELWFMMNLPAQCTLVPAADLADHSEDYLRLMLYLRESAAQHGFLPSNQPKDHATIKRCRKRRSSA